MQIGSTKTVASLAFLMLSDNSNRSKEESNSQPMNPYLPASSFSMLGLQARALHPYIQLFIKGRVSALSPWLISLPLSPQC